MKTSAVEIAGRDRAGNLLGFDRQRFKYLLLALLGWTALIFISTTVAFIGRGGETLADWMSPLRKMATYYYLWALASVAVYRFVDRFPFTFRSSVWLIPAHIAMMAALSTAITFFVHGPDFRYWMLGRSAPGAHALSISIYLFIVIGCLYLRDYRSRLDQERRAREMELRAIRLENRLNVAKLDALRMQVNPHFLFNALNSIASLIETENNVEAYRTTELLGGLLRRILEQSDESLSTLAEEIEFVERYVEIEKVRFGDRLRFEVETVPECLDCRVPSLILQPLVENSIKHAVAPSQGPVTVRVRCRRQSGALILTVEDDGPGFSSQRPSTSDGGVGLENIRQRLRLIYGEEATLSVESGPGTSIEVSLTIPLDEGSDRPAQLHRRFAAEPSTA